MYQTSHSSLLYIRNDWFRLTGGMRCILCEALLNADIAGDNTEPWVMQVFPFPDGTSVFPELFPVPCWAVSLVSLSYLFSEGIALFELSEDLVDICVCTQVPDAVPDWCVGVSILSMLREDQETVGSVFATGGEEYVRAVILRTGLEKRYWWMMMKKNGNSAFLRHSDKGQRAKLICLMYPYLHYRD